MTERVLVVERRMLDPFVKGGNGTRKLLTRALDQFYSLIIQNHSFLRRSKAEHNADYKQVIPYVIIRHGDDFLLMMRTKKQTEKRLHNKFSLGIGGHINPVADSTNGDIIMSGLYRELDEEIALSTPGDLHFIGVLNDDSNSVSRVHLGLLYLLDVFSPQYEILEADKMTAQWLPAGEINKYYDRLETWSRIVYDKYIISFR